MQLALPGHNSTINYVLMPGYNTAISGTANGKIIIWNLEAAREEYVLTGHKDRICGLKLHNHMLFSGSIDDTVRVWDISDGSCIYVLSNDAHFCCNFGVSEDSALLAGSLADGTIKIWDLRSG